MIYSFYEVDLEVPLSSTLESNDFANTKLGKLYDKSGGKVELEKIPIATANSAKYGWRLVDTFYNPEDATMTRFRAYGLNSESLPQAAFGIWFGSSPHRIETRAFDYKPFHDKQYYVPVRNDFFTPNEGGYEVQVLDTEYPSEVLKFGLNMRGDKHEALVISFRLFELDENYPEI